MENFEKTIKINIFKYVDNPMNLVLSCRTWSDVAKDFRAKAEWLLNQYGKIDAFFHAVRFGPPFIDIDVCRVLVSRNAIFSGYFIDKLLKHFGSRDPKLCAFEEEYNVNQFEIESPWASNLPLSVFKYLMEEGHERANYDSSINERVMKLFLSWNVVNGRERQYLNTAYLPLLD
ncbi:hypothetical protein C1645_838327 [Glomus cerebriforme]|uniref:F-box domain-containing protein n=1 Tax=Glomus cerebriforme TaxID=658196 RepID=A0A397SD37_9GLOM|nr:hypothetical protein C1645_838327 [Glomus cerebriforme]